VRKYLGAWVTTLDRDYSCYQAMRLCADVQPERGSDLSGIGQEVSVEITIDATAAALLQKVIRGTERVREIPVQHWIKMIEILRCVGFHLISLDARLGY
jgi:hypothetical protein